MAGVYAIGSNGSGQLGIGHKEDVSVPKPVHFKFEGTEPVKQIKAGGNHTLLLSSAGLYASGDTVGGACGIVAPLERSVIQFEPVRLSSEEYDTSPISLCAATWEASIIVQEDAIGKSNKVSTFGIGNKGELGHGEMLFRSAKSQLIQGFPPEGLEVIDLAASVDHVVVVLSNGDVYGWGNGRKGQLGQPEEIVYTPRKISGLDFQVVRVVCGREFTYVVGNSQDGKHALLGSDKWSVRSSGPPTVQNWKDIGAGWGSVLVLLDNGRILAWGRNDHGQLPPTDVPLLSQIAVGSEHAVGLTTDGDVLAWGWGEHGNCGPKPTGGDVKDHWNVVASSKYLPPESKIYKIGAGCATTWILVSG